MGKEKKYLVRGALLYCDKGSHPRRLNLPKCHGIYVGKHPMIRQDDCKAEVNITYFGVCGSGTAPENGEIIRLAGYVPEGSRASGGDIQGFKCKPKIVGQWKSVKGETNISGQFPAVTMDSYLVCSCGGLIQPSTSGQELED